MPSAKNAEAPATPLTLPVRVLATCGILLLTPFYIVLVVLVNVGTRLSMLGSREP